MYSGHLSVCLQAILLLAISWNKMKEHFSVFGVYKCVDFSKLYVRTYLLKLGARVQC